MAAGRLDSDGFPYIGTYLKEGDPFYRYMHVCVCTKYGGYVIVICFCSMQVNTFASYWVKLTLLLCVLRIKVHLNINTYLTMVSTVYATKDVQFVDRHVQGEWIFSLHS